MSQVVELDADVIAIIHESLRYSKLKIESSGDTPWEQRKEKLERIERAMNALPRIATRIGN